MPSHFENLPKSREHSDNSAVAEAVQRELKKRGGHIPEITTLAEMLDPKSIEAYTIESNEKKKQEMLKKLVESVLEKGASF
jgi:hypothetical protein